MGARQKLNGAYLTGSLLIAGAIGVMTGSWLVFILAAIVLLAVNVNNKKWDLSFSFCRPQDRV